MTDRTPLDNLIADAQPDPEPIAPSLPAPDPGIYHHEPEQYKEGDRA